MKEETVKKLWSRPKLIIIGEGTPEESVLAGCKGHGATSSTGPTSSKSNCNKINDNAGSCGACQSNGGGAS